MKLQVHLNNRSTKNLNVLVINVFATPTLTCIYLFTALKNPQKCNNINTKIQKHFFPLKAGMNRYQHFRTHIVL